MPNKRTPQPTRISNEVLSVQVGYISKRVESIDETLGKVAESLNHFARLDERLEAHILSEAGDRAKLELHGERIVDIEKRLIPLASTRRWTVWAVTGLAGLIGVQAFNSWTNLRSMNELQQVNSNAAAAASALPIAAEKIQRTLEIPIDQRQQANTITGEGVQADVSRAAATARNAHIKAGNP